MMTIIFYSYLATAFFAGLAATLSPCVYPLLPVTLGYFGTQIESGRRVRIVAFSIGQWFALTALGGAAIVLSEAFGFTADMWWLKVGVGVILVIFAIMAASSQVPNFFNQVNRVTQVDPRNKSRFVGALLLGIGSALLLSPCTTPLLGSVFATAATQPNPFLGLLIMSAYGLGFASVFLLIGLGLLNLKRLPRSGKWLQHLHKLASAAILIFGLWQIYSGISDYYSL